MTAMQQEPVTCGLCGQTSEQWVLTSTNAFGSPDLDLRPPEMQRSSMAFWLQECPECGYCTPDLSEECPENLRDLIASVGYRSQAFDPQYPELANRFLRSAMLIEAQGDLLTASHQVLCAAWDCDDHPSPASARAARSQAADLMKKGLEAANLGPAQRDSAEMVLVDVFRRCGRFAAAKGLCDTLLARVLDPNLRAVVTYQVELIGREDMARHRISEVTGLMEEKARSGTEGEG
jgi:hypothetical protein